MKKHISILKETSTWLAVNKPAGLIVERNPWESPTVEELVWAHLEANVKRPYLGIVHRLDRLTSGVLLFAKKKSALKDLNEQFRERSVEKTYLAIVESAPSRPAAELTHWLVKDQKDKRAYAYEEEVADSQAVSLHYKLLGQNESGALLEIQPRTGKFHQIRVQLAAIGCPILGDEKYGARMPYLEKAIALHARSLRFTDPHTQERIALDAQLPQNDFWKAFLS